MKHLFLITLLCFSQIKSADKQRETFGLALAINVFPQTLTAAQALARLTGEERREVFFGLLPEFLKEAEEDDSEKEPTPQSIEAIVSNMEQQQFAALKAAVVARVKKERPAQEEPKVQEQGLQFVAARAAAQRTNFVSRLALLFKQLGSDTAHT